MNWRLVLLWIVGVLVLWWVISEPLAAAAFVRNVVHGLLTFVKAL